MEFPDILIFFRFEYGRHDSFCIDTRIVLYYQSNMKIILPFGPDRSIAMCGNWLRSAVRRFNNP